MIWTTHSDKDKIKDKMDDGEKWSDKDKMCDDKKMDIYGNKRKTFAF